VWDYAWWLYWKKVQGSVGVGARVMAEMVQVKVEIHLNV
jgi:hypothetical protein